MKVVDSNTHNRSENTVVVVVVVLVVAAAVDELEWMP